MTALEIFQRGLEKQLAGEFAEAERLYREGLEIDGSNPDALHFLGVVLSQTGRNAEAEGLIRRAISINPQRPDYHANLGLVLYALRREHEAAEAQRAALHLSPEYPAAHLNLGIALQAVGDYEEALEHLAEAARLAPQSPEAHYSLGSCLSAAGNPEAALEELDKAIALHGRFAWAHTVRGHVLQQLGELDAAMEAYRRAMELDPSIRVAADNALLLAHYDTRLGPEELFRMHVAYGERFERAVAVPARGGDAEKRLKVGYLSPDLYRHPVAAFLAPVLEGMDRERIEVVLYSCGKRQDDMTEKLRGLAGEFVEVADLTDEQIAERVRADGVDVLVDLAGHTSENRLPVFALRAAPVQVTQFGYPDTTGLRSMDWRITDGWADPVGKTERWHTEKLWRMPEVAWCYRAYGESPEVLGQPGLVAGHVTFGCLNNPAKLSREALEAFARILERVEGSRLVIRLHEGERARAREVGVFEELGIEPGRIEAVGMLPRLEYLKVFQRVDVGLDPWPYNGGVSTCDALWMGVPVVTLAGETYVSRQGVSVLSNLGMEEFIAKTPEEYVEIAARAAGDLGRLSEIRMGLREQMQASAVMDAGRFARNLGEAYRGMWRAWCESGGGR